MASNSDEKAAGAGYQAESLQEEGFRRDALSLSATLFGSCTAFLVANAHPPAGALITALGFFWGLLGAYPPNALHRLSRTRWGHNSFTIGVMFLGAYGVGQMFPPLGVAGVILFLTAVDYYFVSGGGAGKMQSFGAGMLRQHLPAVFILSGPALDTTIGATSAYAQVRNAVLGAGDTHPQFALLGVGDVLFPLALCASLTTSLLAAGTGPGVAATVGLAGLTGLVIQITRLLLGSSDRDTAALATTSSGAIVGGALALALASGAGIVSVGAVLI
jgi:hypothetical protein